MNIENGSPLAGPHSPLPLVLTLEIAETPTTGILELPSCVEFGGQIPSCHRAGPASFQL